MITLKNKKAEKISKSFLLFNFQKLIINDIAFVHQELTEPCHIW